MSESTNREPNNHKELVAKTLVSIDDSQVNTLPKELKDALTEVQKERNVSNRKFSEITKNHDAMLRLLDDRAELIEAK